MAPREIYKDAAPRFWTKVEKTAACWLWRGAVGTHGYGVIGLGGHATITAHRFSWALHKGKIQDGRWILHRCDNRRCVNPNHLYLGTVRENVRDMMERGAPYCFKLRSHITPEIEQHRLAALPRGRSHHRGAAKITEATAAQIISASGSQRQIGERFGVSQQLVSLIKSGKRWAYLHGNP